LCQGRPGEPTEDKSLLNRGVKARRGRQIAGRSEGSEVQLLTQRAPKGVGRLVGPAAGVCLVLLAAACASFVCRPLSVTVAEKEERAGLDMVPRGVETTATGRLDVLRAPEIVRDYWVRAGDGTWYRVSLDKFRAAEVGRPLELCQ
jgi:hypothetical protein